MTTATQTQSRLDTRKVCERLSDMLGCHVRFTPSSNRANFSGTRDSETVIASISDGHEELGLLQMQVAETELDHPVTSSRRAIAEVVADVLNQLAVADRRLEENRLQVSTLAELGKTLPSVPNLQAALEQSLQAATKLTASWGSAFFLRNPVTNQLQLRLTDRVPIEQLPFARRPLHDETPDAKSIANGSHFLRKTDVDSAAWLPQSVQHGTCVPVQTRDGVLGTLWCYERRQRPLSDREVHVMQSIAAQIAAVLERSVLLRESETQQRLKRELQLVSNRHKAVVHCDMVEDGRLDVAWRCDSAHEVCGDLCDVFPAGPGRATIAVGDAVGNSLPAAMLMSAARGAFRSVCSDRTLETNRTDVIMEKVNHTLHELTQSEQFVTMVCGVLDLKAMTLTYSNAGHPSPVLLRGDEAIPLASSGLLLGILPDATYEKAVLKVRAGDVLVFYTDGITEAMNSRREIFRYEGLLNAVRPVRGADSQTIANAVWQKLREHVDQKALPDDRTLLVMKIN